MASSSTSKANNSITNHTLPIIPTTLSHLHTSTHGPANGQPPQFNLTQRPILTPSEPTQPSRSGSKSAAAGNGEQGQLKKKRGRPKGSPNKPKHDPSQPPSPKPEPKPLGRPKGSKDTKGRDGYHWKDAEKEANRIARAAALAARQNTQRRQPRKIAGGRQQPLPSFVPAPNTPLGHANSPIPARLLARRLAAPSRIATHEATPLVHVQPISTQPQNIYNSNDVPETHGAPSQLEIGSDNDYGNLEHMGISNDHWDITMQPDQPVQNQQTAAPQHNDPAIPAFTDANSGKPAPWQLATVGAATAPAAHDAVRTVPIAQQPHKAHNNSSAHAAYLRQIAPAIHHTAQCAPMVQQPHEAYGNHTNVGVYTWQPPLWFQAQQALHRYLNGRNLAPNANGLDFFKTIPIELLEIGNEQQPFGGANNNNYYYYNYNYNNAASTASMVDRPIEEYNNYNNAASTAPMVDQPIDAYNYNTAAPIAPMIGQPVETYDNDAAVPIALVVWQSIDAPHNNNNDAGPNPPVVWQPIDPPNIANDNANDNDTEMTGQEQASVTDEEVGSLDFEIDAFLHVDGNLAKCFTE